MELSEFLQQRQKESSELLVSEALLAYNVSQDQFQKWKSNIAFLKFVTGRDPRTGPISARIRTLAEKSGEHDIKQVLREEGLTAEEVDCFWELNRDAHKHMHRGVAKLPPVQKKMRAEIPVVFALHLS